MKEKLKKLVVAAMQAGTTGNPIIMEAVLDALDKALAEMFPEQGDESLEKDESKGSV